MTDTTLNRRAFLSSTGALVVTLAAPADWAEASTNGVAARPPLKGDQLSSYISIDADGIGRRLLRQDRRRAGARNRHRADGGGRDRRRL